jgi:rhomboid protease GluP
VNTVIILINIAVFLVTQYSGLFGGTDRMISRGGDFWYDVVKKHQYYRIITSMFMHSGISHIFNNMLVLLFVGSNLERAAGKLKYLFLYLGSGIIADITSIVYNMWKDRNNSQIIPEYSIGASGAIFGVVGAILYIIIINRGRFKDIDIRQMILFIVFGLYGGIASAGIDNAAHIGGFLSGILLAVLIYRRPKRSMPMDYGAD